MSDNQNRYDMLDRSDIQEEIRIKKMKQGIIPNNENEEYCKAKQERENAPVSFKEKLQNFWFHYKWTVIVVGFLLISVVSLSIQSINKEKYDTTLLLCTKTYYSDSAIEIISNGFAKYMTDTDGNKKINIGVFQANYEANGQEDFTGFETALQSRIMSEIAAGKNCIFIVEKSILESLSNEGVFADLRELLELEGDQPIYGVSIQNAEFLKNTEFDGKRENYYLALRVFKSDGDKELYNAQLDAVKKLYAEIK